MGHLPSAAPRLLDQAANGFALHLREFVIRKPAGVSRRGCLLKLTANRRWIMKFSFGLITPAGSTREAA